MSQPEVLLFRLPSQQDAHPASCRRYLAGCRISQKKRNSVEIDSSLTNWSCEVVDYMSRHSEINLRTDATAGTAYLTGRTEPAGSGQTVQRSHDSWRSPSARRSQR